MKRLRLLTILTLLAITLTLQANEPKHELRATWLATVTNIDWPKTQITSDATRKHISLHPVLPSIDFSEHNRKQRGSPFA